MKRKYSKSKLGKNKSERFARFMLYSSASPSSINQLKKIHFNKGGR